MGEKVRELKVATLSPPDWLQTGVQATLIPYFILLSKQSPLSVYKKPFTVLMDVEKGHVRMKYSLIESLGVKGVNIEEQSQRLNIWHRKYPSTHTQSKAGSYSTFLS